MNAQNVENQPQIINSVEPEEESSEQTFVKKNKVTFGNRKSVPTV